MKVQLTKPGKAVDGCALEDHDEVSSAICEAENGRSRVCVSMDSNGLVVSMHGPDVAVLDKRQLG